MYRLNLLPRKVLITTDEIINQGALDKNPDPKMLLSAIQIAEDRFVRPILGKDMYNDFRDKKNVAVTEINKEYLEGLINEDNTGKPVVLKVGMIINAIEFVDNSKYVELWNEYLWKLCAECVVYTSSPSNYSRYTAQGEQENNPKSITDGQSAASVDLATMKWKMDKMLMDRIDPIISPMNDFLYDNRSYYPLYKNYEFWKKGSETSVKRKSPFVHNIYDRKRTGCRTYAPGERCDDC